MTTPSNVRRAAAWKIATALALVYLSWGTTYFATGKGVKTVPPYLFGGTRICLAGVVLLLCLLASRRSLRISPRDFLWTWFVSVVLFVGGNGVIAVAQQTVDSGLAALLAATTPLWMAVLEALWPHGDRLTMRGWLGVLMGFVGVGFLALPKLGQSAEGHYEAWGYLLVLASAFAWAVGSFAQRHRRIQAPSLVAAAYQMILGGGSMILMGTILGEPQRLNLADLPTSTIGAFFHLLLVGSLIGYVAYSWLLGHVSTTVAGTYAFVNPVVALLVGQIGGERDLTWPVITGMLVILGGVALVRRGGMVHLPQESKAAQPKRFEEVLETKTTRPPHFQGTAQPCSQAEKC